MEKGHRNPKKRLCKEKRGGGRNTNNAYGKFERLLLSYNCTNSIDLGTVKERTGQQGKYWGEREEQNLFLVYHLSLLSQPGVGQGAA